MLLYFLATHHVFMWIAVAFAAVGNLLVWISLERIFMTNKRAATPFYYPWIHERELHKYLERASHLGIVGIELKLIALVVAGVYVACYPDVVNTSLIVAYFVWLLVMTYAVMVAVTRVKRWWDR